MSKIDNIDKVSVIIPTYNRFKYLLNTIESIQNQSYPNLEIIVINDGSSQPEYYNYQWNDIIIIHLCNNSKKKFGYPNVGYVRNQGIKKSTGKYIAFCDDDDIWLENKIKLQLSFMKRYECQISCTEGLIGKGMYNKQEHYSLYNKQHYYKKIYKKFKHTDYLDNGFPIIWDFKFLAIHNCVICSSVIVEKNFLNKIGNMPFKRRGQDYICWMNCLKYSNIVYVNTPCVYYDINHGLGSNH